LGSSINPFLAIKMLFYCCYNCKVTDWIHKIGCFIKNSNKMLNNSLACSFSNENFGWAKQKSPVTQDATGDWI
jgi:hypothetical protein